MKHQLIIILQKSLLSAALLVAFVNAAFADYILTGPPREDSKKSTEMYGPIADKLSEVLGKRVVYEQPQGWIEYANKMRDGYYDIVFDGPHFAAWRVKHLKHYPVAELPGDLGFVLIANKSDDGLKDLRQLAGKRICGMLSPHLGTSLVLDYYPNPVIQPVIIEVDGFQKEVYKAFKDGKCRAAILRNVFYFRLPQIDKEKSKVMLKTRSLPNQTITVSTRLRTNAKLISAFMTSKDGAIAADGLLSRYSKKAKYFEKTSVNRFAGIEGLLEGVVFGW